MSAMANPGLGALVGAAIGSNGMGLDLVASARLVDYVRLLERWNSRMNLASLVDPTRAMDRLILEPLQASAYLRHVRSVVDVGSGGGSPAVILKIALPSVELHMVEVRARRATFLREVIRKLELDATFVHQCRVQDFQQAGHAVTVRAVRLDRAMRGELQRLCEEGGRVWVFGSDVAPDDGWVPLTEVAAHSLSVSGKSVLHELSPA